jgi:hypothetical protein
MILVVVLAILTLFAIVGITFVLYSESAALSARYSSEAQSLYVPDMDPNQIFAMFLSQVIYDASDSDPNGMISALRGHSLARNMYGWNNSATGGIFANITPYNGVGRLHFAYNSTIDSGAKPINGVDDWQLVNYSTFGTLDGASTATPFTPFLIRDPGYFGIRSGTTHNFVGGLNPTYNYPDQNSLFLGAVQASSGKVIAHSYHRDYTGFGTLSASNPNWSWPSNPGSSGYPSTEPGTLRNPPDPYVSTATLNTAYSSLKYMVLRPRPADHNGFPFPEDAGGDVKNLIASPGFFDATTGLTNFNDSFWIDIGAPVLTAPDGRKYKALVAPFIIDLDGKIDVNAVGNIRGQAATTTGSSSADQNFTHMSDMGLGPWEINPFKVLTGNNDPPSFADNTSPTGATNLTSWPNLFVGLSGVTSAPTLQGKYGAAVSPNTQGLPYWVSPYNTTAAGNVISWVKPPHYYSPVDFDGCKNYVNSAGTITPGQTSNVIVQPPTTAAGNVSFPVAFSSAAGQGGHDNYSTNERTDHPSLYNVFNPYNDPAGSSYSTSTSQYNRRFKPSHLERLLRFGDAGYSTLPSDLERLTVENFNFYNFYTGAWDGIPFTGLPPAPQTNSVQRRWMVTTNSADRIAPGLTPYIWSTGSSGYPTYTGTAPDYTQPPYAGSIPYPTLTYGTAPTAPPSLGGTPSSFPGEFGNSFPTSAGVVDYRAQPLLTWAGTSNDFPSGGSSGSYTGYQWPSGTGVRLQTALSRIDLNRRLARYPLWDSSVTTGIPAWQNAQSGNTYNKVFGAADTAAFNEAQGDRQKFADDIYRRLLLVTGIPPAATPSSPTDAELAPRRWLAQLAVNIVDYIDEDDIITPFNFYNNQDDPTGAVNVYATDTNVTSVVGGPAAAEVPLYWVFGTEIPKVVLNEVSAQCENGIDGDNSNVPPQSPGPAYHVAIWAELLNTINQNTLPTSAAAQLTAGEIQQQDYFPIPLVMGAGTVASPYYAPYQIVVGAGGLYQNPTTGIAGNPTGICLNKRTNTDPAADFVPTNAKLFKQKAAAVAQTAATLTPPNPPATAATLSPPFIGMIAPGAGTHPSNAPYTTTGLAGTSSTASTMTVTLSASNVSLTPYYIVGPPTGLSTSFYKDPLETTGTATSGPTVPGNTPMLQTANMMYSTAATGFGTPDDRHTGLTILLRRLANPHMAPNPTPGAGWNPYITVDYMDLVPILGVNGVTFSTGGHIPYSFLSRGKPQPFGGATVIAPAGVGTPNSPVFSLASNSVTANQLIFSGFATDTNGMQHTFGMPNNASSSATTAAAYNWLVHLDRQVISPMELLHASAYSPALLSQKFLNVNASPVAAYSHTAPWFDQNVPIGGNSYRLYRLFEFLDAGNRGAGVAPSGRVAGKLNINTMFDEWTFDALCDPNNSNHVSTDSAVNDIWTAMLTGKPSASSSTVTNVFGRTPFTAPALPQDIDLSAVGTANIPSYYLSGGGTTTTPTAKYDRPFLGLATGLTTGVAGTQFPNNRGIDDTILRSFNNGSGGSTGIGRLFQLTSDVGSAVHPSLQYQLLTKIFNNTTTRSNCFAIWATVGFFQVTDATTTPPTLGPEIGRAEGRNVRHRMFAIVDRTNLAAFQSVTTSAITLTDQDTSTGAPAGANANGGQAVNRVSDVTTVINSTDNRNGNVLPMSAGLSLVFEPGTDNEETVVTYATGAGGTGPYTVEFHKPHASGVTYIIRGNPGPQLRYDPRNDPGVVLHWNIIN